MIRIQKLKQPKKTSGIKIMPGKSIKIGGMVIKNDSNVEVWADEYDRKNPAAKKAAKAALKLPVSKSQKPIATRKKW